jgi:hypothetical protein
VNPLPYVTSSSHSQFCRPSNFSSMWWGAPRGGQSTASALQISNPHEPLHAVDLMRFQPSLSKVAPRQHSPTQEPLVNSTFCGANPSFCICLAKSHARAWSRTLQGPSESTPLGRQSHMAWRQKPPRRFPLLPLAACCQWSIFRHAYARPAARPPRARAMHRDSDASTPRSEGISSVRTISLARTSFNAQNCVGRDSAPGPPYFK